MDQKTRTADGRIWMIPRKQRHTAKPINESQIDESMILQREAVLAI